MSNYTKSTNFATKDALPSGDPLKIVKGTEIDTEFNNIATAIGTKADLVSPTFTGTPLAPTATAGTNNTQISTTAYADAAIAAAKEALYPVGSIYINAGVTTNPATLLGFGTWTAFGAGRVMVGLNGSDSLFDALEETGGSKDSIVVSHTHTATTGGQSNDHSHNFQMAANASTGDKFYSADFSAGTNIGTKTTLGTNNDHSHAVSVASTGSSGTNTNIQPYITVAMWKRTA